MPNWCTNNVSFTHDNPEMIAKIEQAATNQNLFESFVPSPNGEWEHFWAVENWGTKWDASNVDIMNNNGKTIDLFFETAWAPPVGVYDKMKELGFRIDATYHEEGMSFAGHYTSEDGDKCYDYDFSEENWREGIDDNEVLYFLEEQYEMWQQNEEDFDDLEGEEE